MSVHFHPLRVSNITRETEESVVITFDIPADLQQIFQFTQGQTLTIKKNIDEEDIRRSYSICSAPFENKLSIAVKKVDGGKFSCYANTLLQSGEVLDVLPPTGGFYTPLKEANQKNYLAFAAGSGITPVLSIIKATLMIETASTFTLVYGNKSRSSIMFFEALEALKNKYLQRFNFINILSRERTETPINHGRINEEKLAELQRLVDYKSMDEIFICGPGGMLFCVKNYLEKIDIEPEKIHFELFTTPGSNRVETKPVQHLEKGGTESKVTVRLDGRSFDFRLAFDSDSVLDAALKQGADLPYACKGGVCSTCRAKLLEGEIKMDVNYALGPAELEKGFILTCQSHPISEKIVVDFDSA